MLMRFSVSNFLSFGYRINDAGEIVPTEYHLYAGRTEQHKERVLSYHDRKVLKFSSIYGANASGKTNLIRAIDMGKQILIQTLSEADCANMYCRSKSANREYPSLFEYEFTLGDRCFAYGFTALLKQQIIMTEWLYEMDDSNERIIFERNAADDEYYFDETLFSSKDNCDQFHFFMKDANRIPTSLLLHEIRRRNMDEPDFSLFNQIYDWFAEKLTVIYPETTIGASYFQFCSDNKKLVSILQYLDTGITNYDMRSMNESAFKEYFPNEKIAEHLLKRMDGGKGKGILNVGDTLFELEFEKGREKKIMKLMFQHGLDESKYEYGEESDGTKRLIELLDVILNNEEDRVFVIDELDRSLHPQMTIKFVETFLKFSQQNSTQLIITTHESNLMDLNILRRDEIWFAEKDRYNHTDLFTLEKFKIRYDKVVAKDYLSGRYGAVPVFKDFEYVWGGEDI